MVHASTGGMKPKQLTLEQLREVDAFRASGFPLTLIAAAFEVSEYELKKQISIPERVRQLQALAEYAVTAEGR